jgi:putative N6-adenine-specific DNA methylase
MSENADFEIFLVGHPGIESVLAAEVRALGFSRPKTVVGGVTIQGAWRDVWRANLQVRGATRVLARIGSFRVMHLAQLDKRARKFQWAKYLRADVPVRFEASCTRSKIYHSAAAAQRIETAIKEELKAPISKDADIVIKARIEDDLCTISVDTSGESLHKRGHKEGVGKAPMRETMASLFLRQCGFDGTEPVIDPMCGSGTFIIEAAEIAAGLMPGRARSFAFEKLAGFDAAAWAAMRQKAETKTPAFRFHGSDRDADAIRMAKENAERAGVADFTDFQQRSISDLAVPQGPPGLVIVNPPYGTRIGDRKALYGLYGALGKVLLTNFSGWRVGLVTTEVSLAKTTNLPFLSPGPSVAHGGLSVTLYQTDKLA